MITKTRFTSSRIILLTLTTSLFALSAQAELLNSSNLSIPTTLNLNPNLDTSEPTYSAPAPFETALSNVGQAIDNVTLWDTSYYGGQLGQSIDWVLTAPSPYIQRIRDALSLGDAYSATGEKITVALESGTHFLAQTIEQSDLPLNAGYAVGDLLHGVGTAIGSIDGLVYNDPAHPYPVTSLLGHTSNGLIGATEALFHRDNPLQPLLNDQTTGLSSNNGLLAPVTDLLSSVTGDLGGDSVNNPGLLAPITNLLSNGLASPAATVTEAPTSGTDAIKNNGLLAPVTGLVSGLLGGPPR